MKYWNSISVIAFAIAMVLGISGASAQQPSSSQELIDGIIQDVINRTVEAARDEVRRNTGIDPLQRGYHPSRSYKPVPAGASKETRRELRKLNEEHDRKIAKLEKELQRKLTKAEDEFQREAAKEGKAEKIREKIGEENERFDEKRSKILSKSQGVRPPLIKVFTTPLDPSRT